MLVFVGFMLAAWRVQAQDVTGAAAILSAMPAIAFNLLALAFVSFGRMATHVRWAVLCMLVLVYLRYAEIPQVGWTATIVSVVALLISAVVDQVAQSEAAERATGWMLKWRTIRGRQVMALGLSALTLVTLTGDSASL